MTMRNVIRNPLIAAALGALIGAAPLAALYGVRAAQATTPPAGLTSSAAQGGVAVVLPDFSTLVKRYGPAVVSIRVIEKSPSASTQGSPFGPNSPFAPFFHNFPAPQQGPIEGEGSGFIIRPNGVILTNAHVVAGATKITVQLRDRRQFTGKVIGIDKVSDVAVVKIAANDLPTVNIGNSNRLEVGQWVLAIGAPFGLKNSATAGIVSAKGRMLPHSNYVPFIQTDVPINPGNSGGPLFNMQGQVVGINSQIYSRSGGYMGLSFSIPINVAMHVADQLIATGHVRRGELGIYIQPVDQGLADSFGLPEPEGALVSSVNPGSPAQAAGIQPGDVIIALNGQKIENSNDLPVRVASLMPGSKVNLTIWRNHAEKHVIATLGAMGNNLVAAAGSAARPGGRLGLIVRALTPDEQQQDNTHGGVIVQGVSGPAEDAGIEPGDIVLSANGAPVSTPAQLASAVAKSKGHVALLIQRGDSRIFVPVGVQ
ncbi:MAG: DegQ family serine endoprotease [Gammaproteobacteria bacterium]|nr:DegQ family serine endoprotease [Gammaproteobacteria bacterium]